MDNLHFKPRIERNQQTTELVDKACTSCTDSLERLYSVADIVFDFDVQTKKQERCLIDSIYLQFKETHFDTPRDSLIKSTKIGNLPYHIMNGSESLDRFLIKKNGWEDYGIPQSEMVRFLNLFFETIEKKEAEHRIVAVLNFGTYFNSLELVQLARKYPELIIKNNIDMWAHYNTQEEYFSKMKHFAKKGQLYLPHSRVVETEVQENLFSLNKI